MANMLPHLHPRLQARQQRGFSLIELMIGMTVGLIGLVIIYQMMSNMESYRRSTANASNAQENGAISLLYLERDLRQAGNGMQDANATAGANFFGCMVQGRRKSTGTDFRFTFSPVLIEQGAVNLSGHAAPDAVSVMYGNSRMQALPSGLRINTAQNRNPLTLTSVSAYEAGDLFVIGQTPIATSFPKAAGTFYCSLSQVEGTNTTSVTDFLLLHNNANSEFGRDLSESYTGNPVNPTTTEGTVFNLGSNPTQVRYSIETNNTGSRLVAEHTFNTALDGDIADNIINLQAQYVLNDGQMRNAIPAGMNWDNVVGLRVAVIARSDLLEAKTVSPAEYQIFAGSSTADEVKILLNNTDRRYRHKIYQTVVPLRNLIWRP
jgi:type IV pilus assembly protein PilW